MHRNRRHRKILPTLALALAGCVTETPREASTPAVETASATRPEPDPGREQAAPAARGKDAEWRAFEAWDTVTPYRFEELALEELPDGARVTLSREGLAELREGLARETGVAVRAAVLLARTRDLEAAGAMLQRLEQRVPAPGRAEDAGDVVCAAALARFDYGAAGRRLNARHLAALAAGARPHPDLEVRVECACSALALGEDSVVPFLLAVLYTHTPAARAELEDWEPTQTVAWAKTRASHALAARADVPCTFQPDGGYEDQARAARALEERLAELGAVR